MSYGHPLLALMFVGATLLGPWYLEARWIASIMHRRGVPPIERVRFIGFSAAVVAWTVFVAWSIQLAVGLAD